MHSFRFSERKVRRAPRVLRMAVVSQSSVKFGKKRVLLVGATNFMTIAAEVATSKFIIPEFVYTIHVPVCIIFFIEAAAIILWEIQV